MSIDDAAAARPTLQAMLISIVVGAVLLVPLLVWLLWLFQQHLSASKPSGTCH